MNNIPIQTKIKEVLQQTQILYQNKCINADTKSYIAKTCLDARRGQGDLSALVQKFQGIRYSVPTSLLDVVDNAIAICRQ